MHGDRGQEPDAGLERRVAQHELEVPASGGTIAPNNAKNTSMIADARGGEARVPEELHVEHRVVAAPLPAHEGT